MPGFAALSRARWPCRPMTFCSAPSRIAQVLMTTRSAVSIDVASSQPDREQRPAISSESLRFIWQPSVQTWNRGRAAASGRYSVESFVVGRGRLRGAGAGAGAPSRGRRGSGRLARGGHGPRTSVTAAPWYATAPPCGLPVSSIAMDLIALYSNPETWIALLTLTVLEIVLGIDNVIFISILVQRLPADQRDRARQIGLGLAMGMRIRCC